MNNIFFELAIVLSLVSFLGFLIHKAKLPLMIAYLLAGVAISGCLSFFHLSHLSIFTDLPNLGIAFVLFLIGMELDLRELKALGKPIIISSVIQIVISTLAGYTISALFGYDLTESFLLGIGLSFSSTLVIIQLLLEKRDLASLYGKLSIGILLIEDLAAILVLMIISVGSSGLHLGFQQSLPFLTFALKALFLFFLTFILSKYILSKLFDAIAKSNELLFLSAITCCFVFTAIAEWSGFSVTIGAFLAGVALATSPYHYQIQGKIKPLRDFFLTLFFVYLGTVINLGDLWLVWPIVIIFTLYALLIKPLIFLLILGAFGFRKHTIFQTAINLSQISEFSLVILLLGVNMHLIPSSLLSVMAAVAVLSVLLSSILISFSKRIYKHISKLVGFFERKEVVHFLEFKMDTNLDGHIIIVGAHKIGGPIVEYLKATKIPFLVLDFNPRVVERLRQEKINVIYGDIGDPDILDSLQLDKAKLIISTAAEITDNEILLGEIKRRNIRVKVVARALDENHAKLLKKLGAEYVILPEKVSGDLLAHQLKSNWPEVKFSGLS